MKRKVSLLIITALMMSLVVASSVFAAPEVSMDVCVGLQHTNNEPDISYKLTKVTGGTEFRGVDSEATYDTPSAGEHCFQVVAEPDENYIVEIGSADTLSATLSNGGSGFPLGEDGVNSLPLTLLEGDLNNDGSIAPNDAGILVSNIGGTGAADLNEDGSIAPNDAGILVGNVGAGIRSALSARSNLLGGTFGSVSLSPATIAGTGEDAVVTVDVILEDIQPDDFNTMRVEVDFEPTAVQLITQTFTVPFVFTLPAIQMSDDCQPTACQPTGSLAELYNINNTNGTADMFASGSNWEKASDPSRVTLARMYFQAQRQINREEIANLISLVAFTGDPNGGTYISNDVGTIFELNVINSTTSVGMSESSTDPVATVAPIIATLTIALMAASVVVSRKKAD